MTIGLPKPAAVLAAATLALSLAGCGDSTEDSKGTEPPVDATSTTTGATADTAQGSGSTQPSDSAPKGSVETGADICEALSADAVSDAAGFQVTEATPYTGGNVVQELELTTDGCRYELAEADNAIEVAIVKSSDGSPAGRAEFDQLKAYSLDDTLADDFPHEEVAGIGSEALFMASLLDNQFYVNTGTSLLYFDGETGDEPMSRPAMKALATKVLDTIG